GRRGDRELVHGTVPPAAARTRSPEIRANPSSRLKRSGNVRAKATARARAFARLRVARRLLCHPSVQSEEPQNWTLPLEILVWTTLLCGVIAVMVIWMLH